MYCSVCGCVLKMTALIRDFSPVTILEFETSNKCVEGASQVKSLRLESELQTHSLFAGGDTLRKANITFLITAMQRPLIMEIKTSNPCITSHYLAGQSRPKDIIKRG